MPGLKQFYIRVAEGREAGWLACIVRVLLFPFSGLFFLAAAGRNALFDHAVIKIYRSRAKIISVGNITWGGTAKTSMVLRLAEYYRERRKVAVICRGYAQDEPALLEDAFGGGVKVFQDKDRIRLIRDLENEYPILIIDDGFQYRYAGRCLDMVMFNAASFNNRYLIPAGTFREPLNSLRRADMVVLSNTDLVSSQHVDALIFRIKGIKKDVSVYCSHYQTQGVCDMNGRVIDVVTLRKKRVAVISGIAFPDGLFKKIESCGISVCRSFIFPDHHVFSAEDIGRINRFAEEEKLDAIITSVKDSFRLRSHAIAVPVLVLKVQLRIDNEAAFFEEVDQRVRL